MPLNPDPRIPGSRSQDPKIPGSQDPRIPIPGSQDPRIPGSQDSIPGSQDPEIPGSQDPDPRIPGSRNPRIPSQDPRIPGSHRRISKSQNPTQFFGGQASSKKKLRWGLSSKKSFFRSPKLNFLVSQPPSTPKLGQLSKKHFLGRPHLKKLLGEAIISQQKMGADHPSTPECFGCGY